MRGRRRRTPPDPAGSARRTDHVLWSSALPLRLVEIRKHAPATCRWHPEAARRSVLPASWNVPPQTAPCRWAFPPGGNWAPDPQLVHFTAHPATTSGSGGRRGAVATRRRCGTEPVPGPHADGAVARVAHHLLLLRHRVPRADRLRGMAGAQARRPGPHRPGTHLGQGDGRALRGGGGLPPPAVLLDGGPLAPPRGGPWRGILLPPPAPGLRPLFLRGLFWGLPV